MKITQQKGKGIIVAFKPSYWLALSRTVQAVGSINLLDVLSRFPYRVL